MTVRDSVTLALAALALSACSRGCGEDVPDLDLCSGARSGAVDSVAIGSGEGAAFSPFSPGQVVGFVFTEAGDASLPITYRLTGTDVPACVEHATTLASCPAGQACADGLVEHLRIVAPVHTYPLEDGAASETHPLYLAFQRNTDDQPDNEPREGARLEISATVHGLDASINLWLEAAGPDAAPAPPADASTVDAAP